MRVSLLPQLRHLLLAGVFMLSAALGGGLWLASPALAQDEDPGDPAGAVATELTAQGYEVLEVTGPDTDETLDTATVIMTMVSDQLDETVTAQLQAGWVALDANYPGVAYLRNGLEYQQRYILVWVISQADWQSWVGGTLPSAEFWNHVEFAVFDTASGEYLSDDRDFLDKNFVSGDLPGPNPDVDPANAAGPPSSILMDVSSLLIPAGAGVDATALARMTDEQGRRIPGQTITFTVSTRRAGDFADKTAQTDREGVARSSYSPPEDLGASGKGVPVSIQSSGPGKLSAGQKLTVAPVDTSDFEGNKQLVANTLQSAGYKVLGMDVRIETGPTGEVYVYGGPLMESKSAQLDAAFFQQAKAAIGTTLTAYPNMYEVWAFNRVTVERKKYWVMFSTVAANWRAWVGGERSEQAFWSNVFIQVFDDRWRDADEKNFVDKNFGTGEPADAQVIDTPVSYTASLVEEDWGPQNYYGEFSLPRTATMDGFSAELSDGATSWRIYEVNDLHEPMFDSEQDDLAALQLGPGFYFIMVVADGPPASVTVKATLHVRY